MARRARAKPARSKGRRGKSAEAPEFEVTEGGEGASPKAPMGIETGLVVVTFAALVVALVLVESELAANYGGMWPF